VECGVKRGNGHQVLIMCNSDNVMKRLAGVKWTVFGVKLQV
jgi:hypothetical protein